MGNNPKIIQTEKFKKKMVKISMLIAALAVTVTTAFVPVSTPLKPVGTSLQMKINDNDNLNTFMKGASAFAASVVVSSVLFSSGAAFASDDNAQFDFVSSSNIIAGRSGGRAGGRAMSRPMARPMARPSGGGGGAVYNNRNTYIQQRPMLGGGGFGYSPFGYSPFGGMGLGYGLGSMNNVGNEIRDNRQEGEIQREAVELEQAKQKNADLEQRIQQLERSSQPQSQPQSNN